MNTPAPNRELRQVLHDFFTPKLNTMWELFRSEQKQILTEPAEPDSTSTQALSDEMIDDPINDDERVANARQLCIQKSYERNCAEGMHAVEAWDTAHRQANREDEQPPPTLHDQNRTGDRSNGDAGSNGDVRNGNEGNGNGGNGSSGGDDTSSSGNADGGGTSGRPVGTAKPGRQTRRKQRKNEKR
jgi:hypothetical protein